jgi:endonuclease YncB( thermonuclease family)
MAVRAKTSVVPILILLAAVAVWIFDAYRETAPAAPKSRQAPTISGQTSPASAPSPATSSGRYEVLHGCTLADDRGNDGDSFRVKLPDGRTEIIRLYFVDAPESAFKSYGGGQNNHKRIAQQAADLGGISPQQAVEIGKKAKTYVLALLSAAPFTLHTEWDDPFGDRRYHAFIEVKVKGKPRFLHELLVENGLARIHTKGAPLPDGTSERKQKDRLFNLQHTAKSKQTGAWGL